jgi:hypothetical protein
METEMSWLLIVWGGSAVTAFGAMVASGLIKRQ